MELRKSPSSQLDELQQQQQVEQIPNRSTSIVRSKSSQLIPPVTTNRKQPMDEDELNKNISSEYQDIQIRTLTKWMNVQLLQVNEHITHIDKDLRDGKKLLKLLSVVANKPNLKPERGIMRIHELQNVAQALKFLQDQWGADSLPAVASESIVNGDVKSTLAIAFFIMLKYQIQPILTYNDSLKVSPNTRAKPLQEAKLALLYWVRTQLEDYISHHIIPSIQDFSRSWRSGLAFCLLLHRHDPDLLPTLFTELVQQSSHKETWFTLLTTVFQVAEEKLDIPKYLEPADLLVEFPHEPSVMMYVSEMYKVMTNSDEKREKRLHDIATVAPEDIQMTPSDSATHIDGRPYHEVLDAEQDMDELQLKVPDIDLQSNTAEESQSNFDLRKQVVDNPELSDIYQQLDTLSTALMQHDEVQKQDVGQLLDRVELLLKTVSVSPEEKQVLMSRYNELKAEWEVKTKPLDVIEHVSGYVRNSPLFRQLLEMIPRNDQQELVHPLDGTFAMAEEFERSLSHMAVLLEVEQNDELWQVWKSVQKSCTLFRRGVMFAQITSAINEELDVIQKIMADRNTVTDQVIQGLESRIHIVSASIQGVRDEYNDDLLREDTRFIDCIDSLADRYETVRDWVDQVRVWFKEAERIRGWIDVHIKVIEERNKEDHFDPVSREMSIDDTTVAVLNEEHEKLKHEIERFDSDDMDRLRAHVKMLTHSNDVEKELTPADTSTIEITLTTLNLLNHLTNLLNKRSHFIQLLLHRVQWEDLFGNAVQWIAKADQKLDTFLQTKARWSEKEEANYTSSIVDDDSENISEGGIEDIIKSLVSLERMIADFDHGLYADVLDAYQEMESLHNSALPDYLEVRQLGFEKAFEDLMKRSGFSRKVVEQLLSMISIVEKFKELRDVGEKLRQNLLKESSSNVYKDDDIYAEQVQTFKEESARLITNASTCVPYPVVPAMSTAIGANDAHDTEITNENIKSTISAYSMSLALIADALDQLLTSRYQVMSLQSRVDESFEAMTRTKNWMDEKIKLLKKARFDLMLYDKSFSSSLSTSSSSSNDEPLRSNSGSTNQAYNDSVDVNQNEELRRLEKERDGIALRLNQMEYDELTKLFGSVRALEYDVDASNAVSIDRDALVNCVESLEQSHQELKEILSLRGFQLDTLKKRLDWESQWSKSNSHLHTIARKLCDFNIKKARYDPSKENADKPSYQGDHEITQSLQFLQDRVTELDERYLTPLDEIFADMNSSYAEIQAKGDSTAAYSIAPSFILNKQSELKLKYDDLKHLTSYTTDLVTQRGTITEFLMRARDAYHEGEKIKDVVSKKTRRIMVKEEEDGPALDDRVAKFKQEIKSTWEDCGKHMSYPIYNGAWLKSATQQHGHYANSIDSNVTNSAYRSQVRSQIKALLEKKIDELLALEKVIDQSIDSYRDADRMKALVNQYDQEACELGQWVNEQLEKLKNQYVDVSAETFLPQGVGISDLKKEQLDMVLQANNFENEKVVTLHGRIAQLVEDSIKKKRNKSIDVSSAAHQLGEVMEQLSHLKRGLSDQAVTLEAASKRLEWENSLQMGISRLEEMNEQVSQFTVKKNQLISQEELSYQQLQDLQEDLTRLAYQKNKFIKSTLPGIQYAYDAFVEYFPKLSRPIATPDHLEARMESLSRSSVRLQENVEARSKELELIKQRMNWEDMVKKALSYLAKQEMVVENFVEEKARWQNVSTDTQDDDEETILRTEWSTLFSNFKNYEEEVIEPLQKRFESLIQENEEHFDNTSTSILPNSFVKKMQEVQQAQDRTNYYYNFSNEVVNQRCLVSAFILRTAQLEQSAEMIREEFIASKTAGGSSQIVDLLINHSERLKKFKTGIDDVRNNLAASIPFPVRSIENIPTQAKIRDETTNSVIKEAISMRNTRLDELWSTLQQLLESKERVSRRRLSLHTYKQQLKALEAWIDSRYDLLNQTNSYILPNKEIDVEKLKDAVSQVDSVEQAMRASDNLLTLLNSAYEKCVSAFEDKSLDNEEEHVEDQNNFAEELHSTVKPAQQRSGQSWNALFEEVVQTNKNRTTLLIENKIQVWSKAVDDLFDSLTTINNVSEEQHDLLMDSLDQLKNKEYTNLLTDFEASKALIDKPQIVALQKLLNSGLQNIQRIQDGINALHNRLQLNRWIEKYLKDIADLMVAVESQTQVLVDLFQSYKTVPVNEVSERRHNNHQELVANYKLVTDAIADLKESINIVTSQFNSIVKEDDQSIGDQRIQMSNKWEKLIKEESAVSLLVGRSSKWVKLFDSLDQVDSDIHSIQTTTKKFQPDTSILLLEKVAKIQSCIDNALSNIGEELTNDTINYEPFESKLSIQIHTLDKLKNSLQDHVKHHEKQKLIGLIKQTVEQLRKSVHDQLAASDKQCDRYNFTEQHAFTDDIIRFSKNVSSNCQNELDTLKTNQCKKLVEDHGYSEDEVNKLLLPVVQVLEKLNGVIVLEQHHLDLESKLQEYLSSQSIVIASIEECSDKLVDISDENVSEVEGQIESIEESVQELEVLSNFVVDHDSEKKNCIDDCHHIAINTVNKNLKAVFDKFTNLKLMLQDARGNIDKSNTHKRIVAKLNDILSFIENMFERCDSFKITGNAVVSSERELDDMCHDFYQSLKEKRDSVDSLLNFDISVKNNEEINRLEDEIKSAMVKLELLIEMKKKEASREGDHTVFLRIMDEIEKQVALLILAINNASPHYSALVNNKFVKSDLQTLLKNLITAFKQHKKTTDGLFDKAHAETRTQSLEENNRAKDILQKASKRWTQTQSAAAARERELQTCISQLDHEFFTKLAMAKTTPLTHRILQSSSQTLRRENGTFVTSPIPSAIRSTNGSGRSAKSPRASTSKRNVYVPDPDNKLDMLLGQIVNSSPYKITVKIVPDQVGKYWFGDVNPRLVYCRILPSQLVMVRVGGGWVELSQFLREHGFIEGNSSRPEPISETQNQPFNEAYLQTFRAPSPSGRVTIRGGGGVDKSSSSLASTRSSSKSSGSKSPTPGYMDGDTFVSLDEAGNHFVVKMKKADDNAKTPVVSRKKP